MAIEARWPLTREQQELLVMLASLIQRFGAERFLEAPLVRADKRDFPDPWEGTLRSVHQVLYRLCWHAYIDPEIVLEDLRPPRDENSMLRTSEIEIVDCAAGVVTFHVTAIGNDDVAGMLAHKVGELFLELAPGEPFRSTPRVPDEREASVAAVFLGLGVPAANAAVYRRHASEIRGREEHSESKIAMNGGLDLADITLLLAIQDILRDDVQGALSTLHAPQKEWVEKWKDVLDPHEDALREALGLDETRELRPLSRSAAPRVAPPHDETARRRFNVGYETMRLQSRSLLGAAGGGVLGLFAGLLAWRVVLGPPAGDVAIAFTLAGMVLGVVFGYQRWCKPFFRCTTGECWKLIGASDTTCPHCGGTITRTVTQKELDAHWHALRAEEDARDELIDESEFAGDPDADVLNSQRAPRATARTRHAR